MVPWVARRLPTRLGLRDDGCGDPMAWSSGGEPAVRILADQIEGASTGSIRRSLAIFRMSIEPEKEIVRSAVGPPREHAQGATNEACAVPSSEGSG
jgi:hypothetical protein